MGNKCWNFDLDDCDRILRVQSNSDIVETTKSILIENGYECQELLD
jgi:hypothetical protein